jgi:hypothetical protein
VSYLWEVFGDESNGLSSYQDDDQLETVITVLSKASIATDRDEPEPREEGLGILATDGSSLDSWDAADGHVHDGDKSFCGRQSNGLINCAPCLEEAKKRIIKSLPTNEASVVAELHELIYASSSGGISRQRLAVSCLQSVSL